MPDNGPTRRGLVAAIVTAIGLVTLAAIEVCFHSLAETSPEITKYIVITTFIISVFSLEENLRGIRLRTKASQELKDLQVEKQSFKQAVGLLTHEKDVAANQLQDYIRTSKAFLILDLKTEAGAIEDQLSAAFRMHDVSKPVIVLGSFDTEPSRLSLSSILSASTNFATVPLLLIDTKEPYARLDEQIKADKRLSFYLSHYEQIFDPIMIFSNRIVLSFLGKCFIIPADDRLPQDEMENLKTDLMTNSIHLIPKYSKKFEYFTQVFPLLSGKILDSIKNDGYSFSAKDSMLWFIEPLLMCGENLATIREEMEREFKIFSDEILPVSEDIVANWPLVIKDWPLDQGSDLSLVSSEYVLNWIDELGKVASQSEKRITRYIYLSAEQHWRTGRNMIEVKGSKWVDRRDNTEKDFNYIISFLRNKFTSIPNNYCVFVVLVPRDIVAFEDFLRNQGKLERNIVMDLNEVLTNWIMFGSQSMGMSILQYEKRLTYPRNAATPQFINAFFYDDFIDHCANITHKRISRYSAYIKALAAAKDVALQRRRRPNSLQMEKHFILPITDFFNLFDQGQIEVTT